MGDPNTPANAETKVSLKTMKQCVSCVLNYVLAPLDQLGQCLGAPENSTLSKVTGLCVFVPTYLASARLLDCATLYSQTPGTEFHAAQLSASPTFVDSSLINQQYQP